MSDQKVDTDGNYQHDKVADMRRPDMPNPEAFGRRVGLAVSSNPCTIAVSDPIAEEMDKLRAVVGVSGTYVDMDRPPAPKTDVKMSQYEKYRVSRNGPKVPTVNETRKKRDQMLSVIMDDRRFYQGETKSAFVESETKPIVKPVLMVDSGGIISKVCGRVAITHPKVGTHTLTKLLDKVSHQWHLDDEKSEVRIRDLFCHIRFLSLVGLEMPKITYYHNQEQVFDCSDTDIGVIYTLLGPTNMVIKNRDGSFSTLVVPVNTLLIIRRWVKLTSSNVKRFMYVTKAETEETASRRRGELDRHLEHINKLEKERKAKNKIDEEERSRRECEALVAAKAAIEADRLEKIRMADD